VTQKAVSATGAPSGAHYVESLRDGRSVWLNGLRVEVTTHRAFAGILGELRRLCDLQHNRDYADRLTYLSPESGLRVSQSYLLPKTKQDLLSKRGCTEVWSEETWGLLGHSPDYMANVLVGLYDLRDELGRSDARFGANAAAYVRHAAEHGLFVTEATADPQIDRSGLTAETDSLLQVVEQRADGIVVRGAKQLSTLAPLANELFVYMGAPFAARQADEQAVWFATPVASPGLTLLCREPFSLHAGGYAHPFASRYDEMEATVFFEDVFIPWDRVFLLGDPALAQRSLTRLNAWAMYSSQIRFWYRLQTFIGVTTMIADAIGVDGFRGMRDKMGEMVSYAELVRVVLRGIEHKSFQTASGLTCPDESLGPAVFAAQITGRVSDILREIAASGLLMEPSEADLASPELRPLLERYMRGRNLGVDEKSRLFRLAWDLVGDATGSQEDLYERWHRGDLMGNRNLLYLQYDRTEMTQRIDEIIAKPLPLPRSAQD
jgi:4-hydroxyphenylacetate 3-monooxygenase